VTSQATHDQQTDPDTPDVDVIVVGAGMGGIYAVHRLVQSGLTVQGIEGAPSVGGVWHHNSYPGARVDVEGYYYSYFFDPDLYREWKWENRYPTQVELEAYLNAVADKHDVNRHFAFNNWVTEAQWVEHGAYYRVTTDAGLTVTARFLVMATGQLSKPRTPPFEGLEDFEGEWVQTANWPKRPVQLEGRRIAVIGTGSSGVQTVVETAKHADHLYVFQRTPNYSVPAHNGPISDEKHAHYAERVHDTWDSITGSFGGGGFPVGTVKASEMTPEEQQAKLEEHWAWGGQSMVGVFPDQGTDPQTNELVSEFVRKKVREIVRDPELAAKLEPKDYPIGTRRVAVDVGYYEVFNQDNVTLVDLKTEPIERITRTGIRTHSTEYEIDLIVFAVGFEAFLGSLDRAGIRNAEGRRPGDVWQRGPKTYLGLMTRGFPNMFILTGPGSPSVLANMFAGNVQHGDFVTDLLTYMNDHGYRRIEPTVEAQTEWSNHTQEVAKPLLRYGADNYMVHVNQDDQSRFFIPYVGGFNRYIQECQRVASNGYEGFEFK